MTSDMSFKRLPPKGEIKKIVKWRKQHIYNLSSYMWYILPVAKKFGDKVYEVAAKSITASGIPTTANELMQLAKKMQSVDGEKHYTYEKHMHIGMNLTSDRLLVGQLLPDQGEEAEGGEKF